MVGVALGGFRCGVHSFESARLIRSANLGRVASSNLLHPERLIIGARREERCRDPEQHRESLRHRRGQDLLGEEFRHITVPPWLRSVDRKRQVPRELA